MCIVIFIIWVNHTVLKDIPIVLLMFRSDLTQTVTETDFTRQNSESNGQIDEETETNDTNANAISDNQKR